MNTRHMTQLLKALRTFIRDANLRCIRDTRHPRGKRYECCALVNTFLMGMLSGLTTVTQLERFCPRVAAAARRALKVPRQISDSALRYFLLHLDLQSLREALRHSAHVGRQRKAIREDAFHWPAVACDGKTTRSFYQLQTVTQWRHSAHKAYLTTITCAAISSRLRPCLDFVLMDPAHNERETFAQVFASLQHHFARWMQIITYDAGACSRGNARIVHTAQRGYLFGLKRNEPVLYREAERLLGHYAPATESAADTHLTGGKVITRWVWVVSCAQRMLLPYPPWPHDCTLVRVHQQVADKKTGPVTTQDRYYVSNIPVCAHSTCPHVGHRQVLHEGLSQQQFLQLVR